MSVQRRPGQVRIIGGRWRGRKLRIADAPDVRPTPDRVRETLFNWLAPVIHGARCLDLFAGSGALGLEAASRGAGRVVLVEQAAAVVQRLRGQVVLLEARQVEVVQSDVTAWLRGSGGPFDIVFLDPPFDAGLLPGVLESLEHGHWLADEAWVYIETRCGTAFPLPESWCWHREKIAGRVSYRLAHRLAVQ